MQAGSRKNKDNSCRQKKPTHHVNGAIAATLRIALGIWVHCGNALFVEQALGRRLLNVVRFFLKLLTFDFEQVGLPFHSSYML